MSDPKLLIIDDDDANRIAFAGILSAAGYTVIEAADGKEGLAVIEEENPSLIILDVEMPGLSGWQQGRSKVAARDIF